MSTGIFKRNILGELEEILQEHIDYWCQLCQFPLAEGKCKKKALIQKCWDESGRLPASGTSSTSVPLSMKGKRVGAMT